MQDSILQPNVIAYSTAIRVHEDEQWTEALQLFADMQGSNLQPNIITFHAAISACEKGDNGGRGSETLR